MTNPSLAPAERLFACIVDAEEIIAALEHFYAGRMPEGVSP